MVLKNNISTIALSAATAALLTLSGCGGSSSSNNAPGDDTGGANPLPLPVETTTITGDITSDTTWTADNEYILDGNKIKVKDGATLTIEPGTKVYGSDQAYLIVTKGSKLMAEGTEAAPIVFDAVAVKEGAPARAGLWGGVTLLGAAQTNEGDLFYEVDEADADFAYGSLTDEGNADNSGILKYVEIHNSGFAVAPDKEVNGLSLAGIGSGTVIDNITIMNSADDGIELWGGNVDLSNISITGAQDDSFDVDNGYTGTVTNLKIVQTEECAALVEMTNSGDATVKRTDVTIDGFSFTASANQKKEGGLYFKDADTTGSFLNGTIDMSASAAADGALHNKEGVYAAPVLDGVTVIESGAGLVTGADGVAVLQGAWDAGTNEIGAAGQDVTITGDITSDTTWSAANTYILDGNKIKVKNNAVLTIEPGTKIYGTSQAYLIVTKGSTLNAEGTADAPIVFDALAVREGAPARSGLWGGVTILGAAQTNEGGLFYEVDEADADFAYGSLTTEGNGDSSGTLSYVEIHSSGFAVAPDKEVNGLSLAGVGSGTTINNITIMNSADDGIELWGGNVNLADISITGAQDDSFDVDNGYTGTVTNLTIVQTEECAALVEMTNSGDATVLRTNVTIDGFAFTASANQKKEGGLYFKDSDTTGTFLNGTIDMSASTADDGALHNKEGVFASPTIDGVTVTNNAAGLVTGADGAAELQAAWDAGSNN